MLMAELIACSTSFANQVPHDVEQAIGEVGPRVFKYAGVGGIDKPRIVQVGYEADFLEQLRQQVGLPKLIDELIVGGNGTEYFQNLQREAVKLKQKRQRWQKSSS